MRFGNILIVLIILSVAINHNHFHLKLVVVGQQHQYHQFNFQHTSNIHPEQHQLQNKIKQIDDNDIDNNRWSFMNRKTNKNINRRIISLLPQIYNRQSIADRRLLFSFNQLLLSLVAPRLMRYQFDLMMHSVVSELFRKIFVPAIGTSIKGAGIAGSTNQQSILSPLSNLLRNNNNNHQIQNNNPTTTLQHYHQYQQQQQQLSPHSTSSAPNLDLQRLLDNAQKLIALQTLIRNGQTTTTTTTTIKPNNDNELKVFDEKKTILNNFNNKDSINNNGNQQTATFDRNTGKDNDNSYEDSSGKSNPKFNQHQQQQQQQPIHLAISPTDFIDFVRNNWKQNHQMNNNNNNNEYNSTSITTYSNNNSLNPNIPIEQDFHINQKLKPSFLQNNQGNGNDSNGGNINKMKSTSTNNTNIKKRKRFKFYKQKAKLEDFKMSHLTYIDTEVPNYGNQMLINHLDDNNNSASQEQDNFKHSTTDQSKNFSYFFEMPGRNQESGKKSNEDYERANRWNSVLSNMKRFG